MRTKYLIGTTITSLALMTAALVWALPLVDDKTSATELSGIYGHVTIMAIHPDGSADYIQGDNTIQAEGKTAAAAQLWNDGGIAGFNCITLGTDTATALADDNSASTADSGVITPFTNTPQECGDSGVAPNEIKVNKVAGVPAGIGDQTSIIVEFDIGAGDDGKMLSEVSLDSPEGGNTTMSRFILATAVDVNTATVVTVNYTMTTGAP